MLDIGNKVFTHEEVLDHRRLSISEINSFLWMLLFNVAEVDVLRVTDENLAASSDAIIELDFE